MSYGVPIFSINMVLILSDYMDVQADPGLGWLLMSYGKLEAHIIICKVGNEPLIAYTNSKLNIAPDKRG